MKKICKADLHVHTPASKCFNGNRSEEGYIAILKQAKAKGIDLIAVTDHNTVNGYLKMMQIKASLVNSLSLLRSVDGENSRNINDKISEIEEKIKLYEEVTILPGVEITLNPGVHLIVICDENKVHILQRILYDIGYPDCEFGADDDDEIDVDIWNFIQNPTLQEMIVLAPHIDSNKGVWEVLDGRYRARVLSADIITAVSCNSPSQKERIIDILNQPDYRRVRPFAFINASDAHNENDVGNRTSYFSVDDVSFKGIQLALMAPEQCVSDFRNNQLEEILKKTIASKKIICLDGIDRISDAFCAVVNNQYGHIVIGIRQNNIVGVKENPTLISDLINEAFKTFSVPKSHIDITEFSELLGNGKYVYIYTVRCHLERICYSLTNNVSFFADINGNIYIPTISQIETKIHDRLIKQYSIIENMQNEKIDNIRAELRSMKYPIAKQELCMKLCEKGSPLEKYINIRHRNANDMERVQSDGVGVFEGNYYYLMPAKQRLKSSYLRLSGIKFNSFSSDECATMHHYSGEHIFLTRLGGCYYIDDQDYYVYSPEPYLIITLKNKDYSLPAIALWLKSSLSLWYSLRHGSDGDLYSPKILLELFLPESSILKKEGVVEKIAFDLIKIEMQFVAEYQTIRDSSDDQMMELVINKFNEKADLILEDVDKKLFNCLDICENDMNLIINDIGDLNYHNYFLTNTEVQISEE